MIWVEEKMMVIGKFVGNYQLFALIRLQHKAAFNKIRVEGRSKERISIFVGFMH